MADDVTRLRERLRPLEQEARTQAWDRERPWRVSTHVGWDGALPVVDLHDLKAGVARKAVKAVLEEEPAAGAVIFVTGRGRHTLGAEPVLKKVTEGILRDVCGRHPVYRYRALGPARWVWVADPTKAPGQLGDGVDWALRIGFLLFALAAVVGLLARC